MKKGSSKMFYALLHPFYLINDSVKVLDNSKLFAGIVMILLNVGSKFITIQFSRSTEEYLKMSLSKQILVFAMAWMGTREIYPSLMLTAAFAILSEHLFNEESEYCVVPHHLRVLEKTLDTNNDGIVSESEINDAIGILEKARREKQRKQQQESFEIFQKHV